MLTTALEYSADNVPYTPRHHFTVNVDGVEDGDAMVFGFLAEPSST